MEVLVVHSAGEVARHMTVAHMAMVLVVGRIAVAEELARMELEVVHHMVTARRRAMEEAADHTVVVGEVGGMAPEERRMVVEERESRIDAGEAAAADSLLVEEEEDSTVPAGLEEDIAQLEEVVGSSPGSLVALPLR
jgi:hypothetical protein